jgi:hypothetical protein
MSVVEIIKGCVSFECPGCGMGHHARIAGPGVPHPCWEFNGDLERPTLSPSLLVRWEWGEERTPKVCHSFVRDGQIQFLSDCTHEFAGKTIPLPAIEDHAT